MEPETELRIDKFLWAVRLFKTRSKATDACNAGKVKLNEHDAKPSKAVRRGDSITIKMDSITKTIKVKELLKNRVGAALVVNYIEDLTPKEEYDKFNPAKNKGFEIRDRGAGRPTKLDRRQIDRLKDSTD